MIRVHEKDLQRQRAEVKEQHAALEAARTNLRMVELREQRLKVLDARYKEAQAQVETARLKLAKTVIRSPVDGVIGQRNIEPGSMVRGDARIKFSNFWSKPKLNAKTRAVLGPRQRTQDRHGQPDN